MKAALWYAKKDIRIEKVTEPSPSEGEIVVQVKQCGICGTDLHEYTSGPQVIPTVKPHPLTGHKAPIIIGHEFSGEIAALGAKVKGWNVGDRVAVMPLLHCGRCYYCRRGLEHLCEQFAAIGLQWYWGGFAEYSLVKDYQLNKIPDSMSFEQAACVEPFSLAYYGIRRAKLQAGDTVLITGGGPTAVLTMMCCFVAGASKVYASEILPGRLKLLQEMGATETFNPLECNIVDEILDRTDGVGVDVAFECTGIEAAINQCFQIVRKRGTYVQSGLNVGDVRIDPFKWAFKDLNIVGIWCFNTYDFPKSIELIMSKNICVEKLISKMISLEDIVEQGFEPLTSDKEGRELKIQVTFT